jgi:hypothetical protein
MKGWIDGSAVRRRVTILLALGGAALALGVAVYALDRPPGSVNFLPRAMVRDGGLFGPLAGALPTFLHTLAFASMTAAFLTPTRRALLTACAVWAAIDLAFEVSQHPAFAEATGFGMYGSFDPYDLLAAPLGAAAAYILVKRSSPAEGALI